MPFFMTTTQTIVGQWSVAELQKRVRGEWIEEYDFDPGDWTVTFHPNGRMNIEFRVSDCPQEYRNGSWAHDPVGGYILFDIDDEPWTYDAIPGELAAGMVFDPADDGPWLYYFDDNPDIRPTRESIINHHANERHRLKRINANPERHGVK